MPMERPVVVKLFQKDMQMSQFLPLNETQPVQDVSWQEFQTADHFLPKIQRIWLFQCPMVRGKKRKEQLYTGLSQTHCKTLN